MKRSRVLISSIFLIVAALSIPNTAVASDDESADAGTLFTYEAVLSELEKNSSERSAAPIIATSFGQDLTARDFGLSAIEINGEVAIVNHSLVREDRGATASATPTYVDLAWAPMRGVREYILSREGVQVGTTSGTSFRDDGIEPGTTVQYQVSAGTFEGTASQDTPIYGVAATVPSTSTSSLEEASDQVVAEARSLASYNSADLSWYTFIPQARIDAPPVACEYTAGYQFGGDNRGFAPNGLDASLGGYRTFLAASVGWKRATNVVQQSSFTSWTSVYDSSTGAKVDEAQATGTYDAYLLGTDAGRTYVDVRMAQQVGNPFCSMNSIEGAFSITLTRSGSYTIFSGQHRQMPNHEIFLTGFPGGSAQVVYQRQYASPLCLVNMLCPPADMGGFAGTF